MIPDNVIYTDGHDVTITDSKFQVKKHSYKLNGITKYGMYVLKPRRLPGILMVVVGLLLAIGGFLAVLPSDNVPAIETQEGYISANMVLLWIGLALTIIGVVILAIMKKKYAVRIDTAEGERNAVVSNERAYIAQIVDALGQAMFQGPSSAERNIGQERRRESQEIRRDPEMQPTNERREPPRKEPVIKHRTQQRNEEDFRRNR